MRPVTARECGMLMIALLVVVVVRASLWLLPSRAIVRVVRRLSSVPRAPISTHPLAISVIIWAVEAASRRVPRATCLTQALSAKLLLRCFGQDAQLCLGVARSADGGLRAHAWLERNGGPILGGAGVQSMMRLPKLPNGTRAPASTTC